MASLVPSHEDFLKRSTGVVYVNDVNSTLATISKNKSFQNLLKPKWSKFIPHEPSPKQQAYLWLECREAFYGGAVGGGKSDAILMGGLQYADVEGYSGLIIRDTYANLSKSDGLLPRAHEWLAPWVNKGKVHWSEKTKTFHFLEHNSSLEFGYLDGPRDHLNYRSAAYHFVGIDEIVGIRKHQALFMFSRMRRLKTRKGIPIRFRCASNPPLFDEVTRGEWVKERYVNPETRKSDVIFIPSFIQDNPFLDEEEYIMMLEAGLDPISFRQLREGDWEIQATDRFFQTEKIEEVDTYPVNKVVDIVRRWDIAATDDKKTKAEREEDKGPAYTCGVKGTMIDGILYIIDVQRDRLDPGDANIFMLNTTIGDGPSVRQIAEQEPGSSGKRDMWHLSNHLSGYSFVGLPSTGSKIVRARPLAGAVAMNRVKFVRAEWNKMAKDEMKLFPDGTIKDIVDAMALLYTDLSPNSSTNQFTTIESQVNAGHAELDKIFDS